MRSIAKCRMSPSINLVSSTRQVSPVSISKRWVRSRFGILVEVLVPARPVGGVGQIVDLQRGVDLIGRNEASARRPETYCAALGVDGPARQAQPPAWTGSTLAPTSSK